MEWRIAEGAGCRTADVRRWPGRRVLLVTTALGAVLAASHGARAQDIANPAVPFVNNGSINSVRFDDSAAHNAGGVAAVTNNGQINPNTGVLPTLNAIGVYGNTALLGSIINSASGTLSTQPTGIGIAVGDASIPGTALVEGDLQNLGTITAATGIATNGAVLANGSGGTGSVVNYGTINGSGFSVVNSTLAGTVLNGATIKASGAGIFISGSNVANVVQNDGGIVDLTFLSGASGIVVTNQSTTGSILNFGLIQTTGVVGILASGGSTVNGDIVNGGTISLSALKPHLLYNGIVVSGTNALPTTLGPNGGFTGAIVNTGTINAPHYGILLGDGFGNDGAVVIPGGITNTGTINGLLAAIDLTAAGTRPAITVNQNAGAINGAVNLADRRRRVQHQRRRRDRQRDRRRADPAQRSRAERCPAT